MTREEAIDWLARLKSNTVNHTLDMPLWWNEPLAEALDMAIKALEQEPKAGHWIKGYTFPDGAYWKCDKCNELIKVKIPMRYCNNCGAKMDKE